MKKWMVTAVVVLCIGISGILWFKNNIGPVAIPQNVLLKAVEEFILPKGFKMTVFADDVPGARVMLWDSKGRLLVSQTKEGSITALRDMDGDGTAEERVLVLKGLNNPHGMVIMCTPVSNPECLLYIAQSDKLTRYAYDPQTATASMETKLLDFNYRVTDNHKTRSLQLLDEKTLLISVGSSCNVCEETGDQYGKILAYDIETGKVYDYATGLRNAVFMNRNPIDGAVWVTEMGRDGLGDDIPPDEINVVSESKNYGWPICYGNKMHDTDFDKKQYFADPCLQTIAPKVMLQAHSAPLGLSFIPEEGWDESMWYDLLVAYHGSWNRSEPTGYKVVRIPVDAKGNVGEPEDFITGWLRSDGKKIGRPADIMAMPGGVIYITDDNAGIVYKVVRE